MDREMNKDASEMHDLLRRYLGELDWSRGITKDDMMQLLVERDDALATMVNEYIAEGTYSDIDEVMNLIPDQAWQDVQGDEWRGPEIQFVEDVETHFSESRVAELEQDNSPTGSSPGQ